MDNKSYCKLMKLMLMFVIALALISAVSSAVSASGCRTGTPLYFNIADIIPPNVTQNYPAPGYYNDTSDPVNITFNCSVSDDFNLANISLYITNSSNQSFSLNSTTNISGTSNSSAWTLELANGDYTWNCLAYDTSGNFDWGDSNRSVTVNYTAPVPSVVPWTNISPPEGVFEPYNASLVGTHVNYFMIRFTGLNITPSQYLSCTFKTANGTLQSVNKTGLSLVNANYSLNYTVLASDSIINHPTNGYLPWILKNCSLLSSNGTIIVTQNLTSRIYTHHPVYWSDDEITRAVTCEGTPGVYFNNTGKCEFAEDTLFALQMRNGNPVNISCFNYPGVACADSYCNGLYFPTCDPISYFGGYSALSDDPNGYTTFTASFAGYNTPIAYTRYTNTSGTFKLRAVQALTNKAFSFTIYNLTNVSAAGTNVYGSNTGNGTIAVTDQGDGTWTVAYYNFGSYTGTLDFVMNVSFTDQAKYENRTLRLVIAYGTDTNQGNPPTFPATFNPDYGLKNNNESENTSITTDTGGVCGDEANNDFDYLFGTWTNSYDCFDPDCHGSQGDEAQTNEFGSGKTGICSYATEAGYCNDTFDNDYDYLLTGGSKDYTDCHDANCFQNDTACPATEFICNDSINNDWDYTIGETDNSGSLKIGNNGTKYDATHQADVTDCEDSDCNGLQGGNATQFCTWGYETNCSDSFDNDALQLKDCELSAVGGTTSAVTPAYAEYDCSAYCRNTGVNNNTETGPECDDNIDNDWDAIFMTGYYNDQYSSNSTSGAGIDCRWGGYFGYGSNYNPDEDCNMTILSSGNRCELAIELNCSDGFDNDFDHDAAGMPSAGWSANTAAYLAYFGVPYSTDADYDDYDCQFGANAPPNESLNATWCFDGIDNDLDKYYWTGVWTLNTSTGIDCADPDCIGVSNPSNPNQTCLNYEYNASDPFFASLPFPGLYCANGLDDDADGPIDCADTDCFKQFYMCSLGPCYAVENITWDSCADSTDNDFADGTDCADSDCTGMLGSTTGDMCQATETSCDDGFNNDAQGGTDCADHTDCDNQIGGRINNVSVYCRAAEATLSDCYDGFDNDADGNIDCYDVSCNAQCGLQTISGTNPIALPQWAGQTAINSVSVAYIQDYTRRVRRGEWYNITFKMTTASTGAQWTLGTASGARFNKSVFNVSSAYLAGPNAANFTITETVNGFIVSSGTANLSSGYIVSFMILSNQTLAASTYELTYAENTGSQTSLNNYVYHEIDEDIVPVAHSIQVVPNSTDIYYGGTVYLRANITDNYQLGLCDWAVSGAANFNPADSTQCRGSFSPTIEGVYNISVTPKDYYSNIGSPIWTNYSLNIMPTGASITTDKRFYAPTDSMIVNATFNVVGTDALGTCEIFARNATAEIFLASFAATGTSCYNATVNVSGLADDAYSVFARVNETTESDIAESGTTAIFVCSQTTSGICQFADFNNDSSPDVCGVPVTATLVSPADNYLNNTHDPANVTFTCSAASSNSLANISLYITNSSNQSFSLNSTTNIGGTSNSTSWTLELANGVYSWNCLAYAIDGNFDWGDSNRTLTINFTADTTPPTIFSIAPVNGSQYNQTNIVPILVNVTDNTAIDSIIANVTWDSTSEVLSLVYNNNTGLYEVNFTNTTFVVTSPTRYNFTVYANDTNGNAANATGYFEVNDITPPAVNLTSPVVNSVYNLTGTVIINASVLDPYYDNTDTVLANVTLPNGTVIQLVLTDDNADKIFNSTFSNLMLRGQYNITIFANDTSNNINNTISTYFIREAPGGKIIDVINQTVTYEFYNVAVMRNVSGLLDLNVTLFGSGNMKYIEIYNHTERDPYSIIRIGYNGTAGGDWHIQWSIDLTGINLTHAAVALNSTGKHLFKCNDSNFNFTTQECDDAANYTQIRTDLVPGQLYYEYYHISNMTDPGYIETVQGADNTTDSWFRERAANQNNGGSVLMRIGKGVQANDVYRGIIKFNLSSIPTGVTITNASLEMYFWRIQPGDDTGNRTHDVHLVNQSPARDWQELEVTWNEYSLGNSWTNGGGDYISPASANATFDSTALDSWITWNVTSDVISLYANQTFNFGWVVMDNNEAPTRTRRDYHSSEYSANESLRPRLIIEYADIASPVITLINCTPDPANISDSVTCIANVTDNIAIGTVLANVTHTNGSVFNQSILCSGTNTSQICNFTFIQTTLPGLYNISWFVNDTSSNNASADGNFTVQDLAPPVLAAIDCQPDPANISDNVTCTANVTDNAQVGSVIANVSHVNGSSLAQSVLCSGNVTFQLCNFTFTQTTLPGLYNVSWFANDTSNNNASAVDNFTVQDLISPVIIPINCTPDPANVSSNVTCTANVTDNAQIDTVLASVIHTNGTVISQLLSCSGTGTSQLCNFTFNQTTFPGLYNVSWFANDTSSNNATAADNFTVIDVTSPVFGPVVCLPNPADVGSNVTCTVNVTDNIGIGTVLANTTHANSTVLDQAVSCSGTNTSQTCSFTFVQTTLPGLYNVSWFANDTSSNNATTAGNFTVADLSPPVITTACVPDPANINDTVTCTASVTDNLNIDNVSASVMHVNGTLYNQTVSCAGTNISLLCNFTFNLTTQVGLYNVTWFANDTTSNNATALDSFTVQNVTAGPPTGPGGGPGGGGLGWDPRYASAYTVHGMPEPEVKAEEKPREPARPAIRVPALLANITLGEPEELPRDYIVKAKIFYLELIFTILAIILLILVVIMIAYSEIKMRKYRK